MIQNKRNKDANESDKRSDLKHKKVTNVYGSKQVYSYSLF